MAMHILMIEDDLDLGRGLASTLKASGISCQWVRRLADAPAGLEGREFDCVLLDLSLPDGEGLTLLNRWRAAHDNVPVVIMTARSELETRLEGLDRGADDFIVKPFAPAELVSRLNAVVRRSAAQASETWVIGTLEIDHAARVVRVDGQVVDLTPREFALARELARQAEKVISKDALARRLAPFGDAPDPSSIEVHVFNLRRKIGAERIRTVRGVGYSMLRL